MNVANDSSTKFGLNTMQAQNSERDSHPHYSMQSSQMKSRLMVPAGSTQRAIFLHQDIKKRNKSKFNLPSQQQQQLSPAPPNRSKLIVSQQTSVEAPLPIFNPQVTSSGGAEHKMQQLHQQFTLEKSHKHTHLHYKNQGGAPLANSPKANPQQTPISNRKKKASLVFRGEEQQF